MGGWLVSGRELHRTVLFLLSMLLDIPRNSQSHFILWGILIYLLLLRWDPLQSINWKAQSGLSLILLHVDTGAVSVALCDGRGMSLIAGAEGGSCYFRSLTNWRDTLLEIQSQSQSQSHIATDGQSVSQSVSQSWCRAPSRAHDQMFVSV
jgi:hypothetical protein